MRTNDVRDQWREQNDSRHSSDQAENTSLNEQLRDYAATAGAECIAHRHFAAAICSPQQ